jgi:hypothetical protein
MRLVVLSAAVVFTVACNDSPFADPDNPTTPECTAIEDRWLEVANSLDRSCTTDADCVLIGDGGYCEGGQTSLGPCQGFAVSGTAASAAQERLAEAARGWGSCTCELVECGVDCELGVARCTEGICTAYQLGCGVTD